MAPHVPGCLPPRQPAPHPGRYHRTGDPWPLYACLDAATMWAEWRRAAGAGVRPQDVRRAVCRLEVDVSVLDLREAATRRALGVTIDRLVADWSPERANEAALSVLDAARRAGAAGAIVPSAARRGGWNLAILPDRFSEVAVVQRTTEHPSVDG